MEMEPVIKTAVLCVVMEKAIHLLSDESLHKIVKDMIP